MDKQSYNVIYEDGTYQTFEMTKQQFDRLGGALVREQGTFITNEFILILKDIRTVVIHKEPVVENQVMTGLPEGLTPEQMEWLRDQAEMMKESNGSDN